MGYSSGSKAQLGMAASGTTATERYEFLTESVALAETFFNSDGIAGNRSRYSERTRQNTRAVSGSITLHPNSVELDVLLPRILGTAEVADSFTLAETLPTFSVIVDRVEKRFYYESCKVSRATFRASQGGPLELQLDIEGVDEAVSATAFPALSISTVGPYMFSDAVLSVAGSAYSFRDFELTIDNQLQGDRFLNSLTRTALPEGGRAVQWTLNAPYGDSTALYGLAAAGVACVATFTQGARSIIFSSDKVSFPRQGPTVPGKEEIMFPLVGMAGRYGSTLELVVTNDSTG